MGGRPAFRAAVRRKHAHDFHKQPALSRAELGHEPRKVDDTARPNGTRGFVAGTGTGNGGESGEMKIKICVIKWKLLGYN